MNMKSLVGLGLIVSLTGIMSGCGQHDYYTVPTTVAVQQAGPAGKVIQGPVNNATVVAKQVGNFDFSKIEKVIGTAVDEDSVKTSSDGTGTFSFAKMPAYAHTLVMLTDGTDSLTGKPNIQMIAKSGSTYITPLTTIVAADTTGLVEAKLVALAGGAPGSSIGSVDTSNTTAAAMIVAKTIETAVAAMAATVTAPSGASVPEKAANKTQLAVVQAQTLQAIATEIAKPTVVVATLQAPATLLATVMTPAITAAATSIDAAANVVVTNKANVATAIATAAVDSSATIISGVTSASAVANTSTTTIAESSKINVNAAAGSAAATAVTTVTTATNTAVTTAAANMTVSQVTTYVPVVVVQTALTPSIISSVLTTPSTGGAVITVTFNHAIATAAGAAITVTGFTGTTVVSGSTVTFTTATSPAASSTVSVSVAGYIASGLTTAESATSYAGVMTTKAYTHAIPAGATTGSTGSSSVNF